MKRIRLLATVGGGVLQNIFIDPPIPDVEFEVIYIDYDNLEVSEITVEDQKDLAILEDMQRQESTAQCIW